MIDVARLGPRRLPTRGGGRLLFGLGHHHPVVLIIVLVAVIVVVVALNRRT